MIAVPNNYNIFYFEYEHIQVYGHQYWQYLMAALQSAVAVGRIVDAHT